MGREATEGATGGVTSEDRSHFIQNRAPLYSAVDPDVASNVFRDVTFASFGYADGRTAIQAEEASFGLGNVLQLQVGADEATLIGNDNSNVAVRHWWAA